MTYIQDWTWNTLEKKPAGTIELTGAHEGRPFLVCGNGASVDLYPQEFYDGFPGITIGCNRIPELFFPDYFMCLHRFEAFFQPVVDAKKATMEDLFKNKMKTVSCKRGEIHCDYWCNFIKVNIWNSERNGRISSGRTSAICMISLAYQMGASAIFFIGMDFARHPMTGELYFGKKKQRATHHGWYCNDADNRTKKAVKVFKDGFLDMKSQGIPVVDLSPWGLIPNCLYGEFRSNKEVKVYDRRPKSLRRLPSVIERIKQYKHEAGNGDEPGVLVSRDSDSGHEADSDDGVSLDTPKEPGEVGIQDSGK